MQTSFPSHQLYPRAMSTSAIFSTGILESLAQIARANSISDTPLSLPHSSTPVEGAYGDTFSHFALYHTDYSQVNSVSTGACKK